MAVLASVSTVVASQQTRQDRRLQESADAAALAGVNALAAGSGISDTQRADVAVNAARAMLSDSRMSVKAVTSSAATMSVEVTLDDVVKGANIKSVAHYVQPGDAIAPQQSSSLKSIGSADRAKL